MNIQYIQKVLNIEKGKAMNRKVERGYPTLFKDLERLVKRARRTNLEGLDRYARGSELREALVNLIHAWDRSETEGRGGNNGS
jgi:hypothetical protein